jgi:hypothetical protein
MIKILIQIIIPATIASTYFVLWLWSRRRIKARIKNTGDRKKYRRFFNRFIGTFFAPLFLSSAVIDSILFADLKQLDALGLTNFVLRIVLLFSQLIFSILTFRRLRLLIIHLKRSSADKLMADYAKFKYWD